MLKFTKRNIYSRSVVFFCCISENYQRPRINLGWPLSLTLLSGSLKACTFSSPTPEKIYPTFLEIPPNSWANEAFSLTSNARAFLVRGTQYPLSLWLDSEISQVMGGTVDTRSSFLPPTWCIRLRERKRERDADQECGGRAIRGRKMAESKLQLKSQKFDSFHDKHGVVKEKADTPVWDLILNKMPVHF